MRVPKGRGARVGPCPARGESGIRTQTVIGRPSHLHRSPEENLGSSRPVDPGEQEQGQARPVDPRQMDVFGS